MRNFYSIVKLTPYIFTGDSIAIGIVLFDGGMFRTFFSKTKIKIASKLLATERSNIGFVISQIENKCAEINKEIKELKLTHDDHSLMKSQYYDYLHAYANGVIQFSEAKPYIGEMDDDNFKLLVSSLFGEEVIKDVNEQESERDVLEIVEKKLISRVRNKIHTDYQFSSNKYPDLPFNFNIDCIGKNGALIGAKTLSFNQSLTTIDKNIGHYFTIISTFSQKEKVSLQDNAFYLISTEPSSISSKEHKFWESIKKNNLIKIVDPEESGEIADIILESGSKTFLF